MKCKKADSAVIGYLFKTISPNARKSIEKHLALCAECRARFERFRRTQALLDEINDPAPPKDLTRKVLRTFASQPAPKKPAHQQKKAPAIPRKGYIEALGKTAGSEQMRVYHFLTKLLGRKKGEAAFDEYLQEQMRLRFTTAEGSVITYEDLVNTATGERSVSRTRGDAVESTVEHCSFPVLAEEMGINNNPCETICRRQIRVVEKLKSVKIQCLKHRSHAGGECVFIIKPAGKQP